MKKEQYDLGSVLDSAMIIIHDEHQYSVGEGIDTEERVTRIVRIAESAGKLLTIGGMGKREAEANIQRIIRYGRQLFIDEMMDPIFENDELPDDKEAIQEFEQYLKKSRRTKKTKSSNQAL